MGTKFATLLLMVMLCTTAGVRDIPANGAFDVSETGSRQAPSPYRRLRV